MSAQSIIRQLERAEASGSSRTKSGSSKTRSASTAEVKRYRRALENGERYARFAKEDHGTEADSAKAFTRMKKILSDRMAGREPGAAEPRVTKRRVTKRRVTKKRASKKAPAKKRTSKKAPAKKGKLTGAAKAAFLKRMAAGRREAARR